MGEFFELGGTVAVITGGTQGIGAAISRRFAKAGAKVARLDLASAPADDSAPGIRVSADVTSESDVARAMAEVREKLGPVTILVNNAGITGRAAPTWDLAPDEVRRVFEVNLIGPYLTARAVVPGMLESKFGRIVNVASIAGKEGNPNMMPYSSSKAAVIGLTKSLAKELCGKGDITVNAIAPAVIRTPILEGLPQATVDYMVSKIPMGRTGTVDEVAALVHYLASRESSFCTGQCYDISGGRGTY